MRNLSFLPPELVDLVCMFAYNLPHAAVVKSANEMCCILDMNMPFFFFRKRIWCWQYAKYLTNPLSRFLPIEYFGGRYTSLFDEDVMYYFLLSLDFRRRKVKVFGSRTRWLDRFLSSWRTFEPFGAYYKMLMRSKTQVLKTRRLPFYIN